MNYQLRKKYKNKQSFYEQLKHRTENGTSSAHQQQANN